MTVRDAFGRALPGLATLWLAFAACLPAAIAETTPPGRAPALAVVCVDCHGAGGNSTIAGVPSLAGQPEYWLLDQLILMQVGVRKVPEMVEALKGLGEADFEALAAHYSAQPAERTGAAPDPALVEEAQALADARRCASCHGSDLEGREAIPRLAMQRIDYLIDALLAYRNGTRRSADTNMTAAVRGLTDGELTALAHYASAH